MDENRIWQLYHQELAIQVELEKAFVDASENDQQAAAFSRLQYQRGRVGLLMELATVSYMELKDEG